MERNIIKPDTRMPCLNVFRVLSLVNDYNSNVLRGIDMKKKALFALVAPLLFSCLIGCNRTQFKLIVDTDSMLFQNQVRGTSFDKTGLNVYLEGFSNGRVVRQEVEWSIDAPEIIEGDNWSATIHIKGYDDKVIFGEVRDKVKVACIGDSLTAGHTWQSEAYPVFLGNDLGERFTINNYGINGVSITGYGGSWDNPDQRYIKKQEFTNSKNWEPDVIVMCLGTNDGTNWASAETTFVDYYHVLIDAYQEALPDAQWVFMVSPPCKEPNAYNINNEAMREHINPVQRDIAEEYDFPLIDLREEFEDMEGGFDSMLRPTWNGQPDLVHFSKEGAQYVASRVKDMMMERHHY